jgi:hypothetical protein
VKPPRFKSLLDKSVAACLAAIEVYNKPDFRYREETFSVLLVNAWELLLKARLVQSAKRMDVLYTYERKQLKTGNPSRRLYPRRNRTGNPMTIGFQTALGEVLKIKDKPIDNVCAENLLALLEIRDNAIHLTNKNLHLGRLVQAIAAGALRNYLLVAETWFGLNLDQHSFFLLPLALPQKDSPSEYTLAGLPVHARNLGRYLAATATKHVNDNASRFSGALDVEVRYIKTFDPQAQQVRLSDSPDATKVTLSDDQFHAMYPMSYGQLTDELCRRYRNFKVNGAYHAIRKPLLTKPQFCHKRLLDPARPNGGHKYFFSHRILMEFDRHYGSPGVQAHNPQQ